MSKEITEKTTSKNIKMRELELKAKEEELRIKEASINSIKKIDDLLRHIGNVQEACILLGKKLIEKGEMEFGINLIANSMVHDFSKFKGVEWDYLNRESATDNKSNFFLALEQHQTTNMHHPEYWGSNINDMPRIYTAEMVCDWYSRSVEMGTDIWEFFTETAIEKYSIAKNGKKYKEIKEFLDLLLDKKFKKVK